MLSYAGLIGLIALAVVVLSWVVVLARIRGLSERTKVLRMMKASLVLTPLWAALVYTASRLV